MTTDSHVLVVDDELHIRELLRMGLQLHGFRVTEAETGRSALRAVEEGHPDLVVLDVMLPDLDGVEVVTRLRRAAGPERATPVILLTARDATEDRVAGLRSGSDDYVTKPFSIEELIERVKAVLRRAGVPSPGGPELAFADLTMDTETRDVRRGDALVELTPTEYRLLHELLVNARKVLTREQLLRNVWDYDFTDNASVLETYISYLRAKVDAFEPPLIHTVRGVGYSLRLPRS